MRVESRIHSEGDMYRFEILDADDVLVQGEDILCESLHLCEKSYANEATAERHANKWITKFKAATDRVRRTMCGHKPANEATPPKRMCPVRRRVGS